MKYELKRRRGMRHIRISVHPGGRVLVSAGLMRSLGDIERFIEAKRVWIERAVERSKAAGQSLLHRRDPEEYRAMKGKALQMILERLNVYNKIYQQTWSRVCIKQHRRLWGSCSRRGNLNFNYKLILLPQDVADYVIVHELCHRIHFNHSKKFWNEVARAIPDYPQKRKHLRLMARGASLS